MPKSKKPATRGRKRPYDRTARHHSHERLKIMPKSKKPARKAAKAGGTAAKPAAPVQPKALQRPGADAARHMAQQVKPLPLMGKSRGR